MEKDPKAGEINKALHDRFQPVRWEEVYRS